MTLSKAHNLSQPCRRWLVSLLRASITRVRPPYPTLPYPTPATTVAPSFFSGFLFGFGPPNVTTSLALVRDWRCPPGDADYFSPIVPLNQGFDKRGFVWYTNFESRKSQEMSHNPYGALSFWWSEVQRAVRIEGVVCKVNARAKKRGGEQVRSGRVHTT